MLSRVKKRKVNLEAHRKKGVKELYSCKLSYKRWKQTELVKVASVEVEKVEEEKEYAICIIIIIIFIPTGISVLLLLLWLAGWLMTIAVLCGFN